MPQLVSIYPFISLICSLFFSWQMYWQRRNVCFRFLSMCVCMYVCVRTVWWQREPVCKAEHNLPQRKAIASSHTNTHKFQAKRDVVTFRPSRPIGTLSAAPQWTQPPNSTGRSLNHSFWLPFIRGPLSVCLFNLPFQVFRHLQEFYSEFSQCKAQFKRMSQVVNANPAFPLEGDHVTNHRM